MWFKKQAYIIGYNSNTAYDGTDWRTNGGSQIWSASQTLPSAADANKYFYLPAVGNYNFGQLYSVGGAGLYWSSSAGPWGSDYAYYLRIRSGDVSVDGYYRYGGFRVGAFE